MNTYEVQYTLIMCLKAEQTDRRARACAYFLWLLFTQSGVKSFDAFTFYAIYTHSGGKSLSSSMDPMNPNSVLICSAVLLGDTFVTWITLVLDVIVAQIRL